MAGVKECNHEVSSGLKSGASPASLLSIPRYLESKRPMVWPVVLRSKSFQKKRVGISKLFCRTAVLLKPE